MICERLLLLLLLLLLFTAIEFSLGGSSPYSYLQENNTFVFINVRYYLNSLEVKEKERHAMEG